MVGKKWLYLEFDQKNYLVSRHLAGVCLPSKECKLSFKREGCITEEENTSDHGQTPSCAKNYKKVSKCAKHCDFSIHSEVQIFSKRGVVL